MKRTSVAAALEWLSTFSAAVLLAVTAVTENEPNTSTYLVAPSTMLLWVGLGLILIGFGARFVRTGRLAPPTPLNLPLLLFILSAVVGWRVAYNPDLGTVKLYFLICATAIFLLLAGASSAAANRFAFGFVGTAAALALVFATQHDFSAAPAEPAVLVPLGLWLNHLAPIPRLAQVLPNANVIAGMLAVAVPFCLGLISWTSRRLYQGDKNKGGLWLVFGSCVLALLALLLGLALSGSLGAWSALAIAAGLWLAKSGATSLATRLQLAPSTLHKILKVAGIIAALAIVLVYGLVLARSLPRPALAEGGTLATRASLYRNTFFLAQDYIFSGAGLGSFQMVYSTYSLLIPVGFLPHAHHWYLEVWFEQGLIGLISVLWLLGAAAHLATRRDGPDRQPSWLGSAAAWAIVVLALHGLIDAPLYGSRSTIFLLVPFGLLVAGRRGTRSVDAPAPKPAAYHSNQVRVSRIVPLLLLLVIAWIGRRPILAAAYANLGALEQTRIELQNYSWPAWSFQDEIRQQADLNAAAGAFRQALHHQPSNATANRRLGMIALADGDYAQALAYLEVAYSATPGDNATRQLLGEAFIANGRVDEGVALWQTVDRTQRRLEIRNWWYEYCEDETRAGWMNQAIQQLDF